MKFTQNNLFSNLPNWYGDTLEMQKILETEGELFVETNSHSQLVQDASSVLLCDEESLTMYEKMFRIIPDENDSLETRRERILIRKQLRRPFSLDYLIRRMDDLIGKGTYSVQVEPKTYWFMVDLFDNFNPKWIKEVNQLILVTLPANLTYTIRLNFSDTLYLDDMGRVTITPVTKFRVESSSGLVGMPLESYGEEMEVLEDDLSEPTI